MWFGSVLAGMKRVSKCSFASECEIDGPHSDLLTKVATRGVQERVEKRKSRNGTLECQNLQFWKGLGYAACSRPARSVTRVL